MGGKWSNIYLRRAMVAALLAFGLIFSFAPARISVANPKADPFEGLGQKQQPGKRAAIVIDDFGNNMQGTEEMLELSAPITAAVMPFLPSTKQDAERAHAKGKDVIIHLPMEPVKGKKSWLGPGAITTDLSNEEIRKRVEAAVADVPYAIGMNNHMGSKATADSRVMRVVLEVCKEHNLFFLDSRTTGRSVIGELSAELGVKTASNGLFFDEVYTLEHITKQIARFKKQLNHSEQCIAIGHVGVPGKKTSMALKQALPELSREAEFVPVKALVR